MKAVCFSGHRDMEETQALRDVLSMAIGDAIAAGFDTFYTGMARGFDIVAAESVLEIRYDVMVPIKLICVVPYRGQESRWAKRWQRRHDSVLKAADGIVVMNDKFITGCYHERNRYLVEHASRLICLHSGRPGGTQHTMGLARGLGLEIINLWDRLGV